MRVRAFVFFLAMLSTGIASAQTVIDTKEFLAKSALVVRATASSVDPYAYDSASKLAYTYVMFKIDEILLGNYSEESLEFWLPGGILPNGHLSDFSTVPQVVQNDTYLLFIKNGKYDMSPFVGDTLGVFREESISGETVYVDPDGHLLEKVDNIGLHVGQRVAESNMVRMTRTLGWDMESVNIENLPEDSAKRATISKSAVLIKLKSHISEMKSAGKLISNATISKIPDVSSLMKFSPDPKNETAADSSATAE